MLQIETILNRLDYSTFFDEEVNAALRDGWTLKKRTVLRPIGQSESVYGHMMLYAELEKEVTKRSSSMALSPSASSATGA